MHVHAEDQLAPRDVLQLVDERAGSGRVAVIRWRSKRLNGCVPAEPTRRPCSRAIRVDVAAQLAAAAPSTSAGVRQTGVAISSTDCISSGLMRGLELVPGDRREHGVDVLHEVERLGVEQHVLLLDAERVRVALAERVVEDAAARRRALLPVIDGGIDLLHGASHRLDLDLDEPARVEQPRRRRRCVAGRTSREDLAVRARRPRRCARRR